MSRRRPSQAPGPAVVQFGAGNIGRGFLGQLWTEGGHAVRFVDVDAALVDALNRSGSYPLRLVDNQARRDLRIGPVRAINGRNVPEVADELAGCAFACTAVGVPVFEHLAPTLAAGIRNRAGRSAAPPPLNILCCENQAGAGALLRAAVEPMLPADAATRRYFRDAVAFVDASVGRMVPPPAPELRAEDTLLIAAEPYSELPIDADAWLGPVPEIRGLLPRRNFAGYVARKLYTHNGGHALLAYEGYLRGHTHVWQAAEDPDLAARLRGFWDETGAALCAAYGFDGAGQRRHEDDLLIRFRNRALGDTIARVARDPLRKLRPDDRLVGAARLCWEQKMVPLQVCAAIAAALRYDAPDDPSAGPIQAELESGGVRGALRRFCGLGEDSPLVPLIENAYAAASA